MNEMIEQAARALWGEWALWAPQIREPKPSWDELLEGNKDIVRRMVVAVITAIRAPTIEMEIAGTEQWTCVAAMEDRSAANWRAMIDAILNGDRP